MNHPPIPPNCKHFKNIVVNNFKVLAFFISDKDQDEVCWVSPATGSWYCLDHRPKWRPIVADVARRAWLDEAEKREFEPKQQDGTQTQEFDPYGRQCHSNADAWRKWGLE